ncbi:hypothetical protein BDV97DRAFT_286675 [Delphinella strobiligena]|nr:hypothetical protein BDV97DRAFT_286675 [Delphinella strobiligena]
MCKYYAYSHSCGHTQVVFASHCSQAAMQQQACGGGEICAAVELNKDCSACDVALTTIPGARRCQKGRVRW